MDRSLMVFENLFCTTLLSVPLQVTKNTKNLESNFSKEKINLLSHITLYLEDDDHKSVEFHGETMFYLSTN